MRAFPYYFMLKIILDYIVNRLNKQYLFLLMGSSAVRKISK